MTFTSTLDERKIGPCVWARSEKETRYGAVLREREIT